MASIARDDLISVAHRVAVWIASYTDILFALNRRYYPGEKRLAVYMQGLPDLPENAAEGYPSTLQVGGKSFGSGSRACDGYVG